MSNQKQEKEVGGLRVRLKRLLALHRTLGLTSALFVIVLSLTGLALQHSSRFDLDASFLKAEVWLSWYQIEIPNVTKSYVSGDKSISLIADSLYFDTSLIANGLPDIKGLISIDDMYVAVSPQRLFLISGAAELIEILDAVHGVPGQIEAVAISEQNLLLMRTSEGVYQANLDALNFDLLELIDPQISWSEPSLINQELNTSIRNNYGDSLLSWERLILDIHSGRIFGQWGVVLVDIMAVLFLIMAVTGVWIWSRRRSSKQAR